MPTDDDPQPSGRNAGGHDQDGGPSWWRRPLTIPHLCALGIVLVGVGIPDAVKRAGWAWLGLGSMVIIILAMMMLYDGWRTNKRLELLGSALKRTRGRRRSAGSKGKAPRRTVTRGGGKSIEESRGPAAGAEPPRIRGGPLPADRSHARRSKTARRELPGKQANQDRRA